MKALEISEMQREVDRWISQFKEGYWQPLAMLARLIEEVGELAREINHRFGEKPKKPGEPETDLALELGDLLFIICAFANSQGIDLGVAFSRVMEKYRSRDKDRWTPKEPSRGSEAAGVAPVEPASESSLFDEAAALLKARGVDLDALAQLVLELQQPYNPSLTLEECRRSLEMVLAKREVQHAIITGISLDMMAEEGLLREPLGGLVRGDFRLYSIDKALATSVINIYGSIGMSNFGYLGVERPGVLAKLNQGDQVNTFLDDLVAALVAAACARIAHNAGRERR